MVYTIKEEKYEPSFWQAYDIAMVFHEPVKPGRDIVTDQIIEHGTVKNGIWTPYTGTKS